jgi:hypothetical protein
LLFWTRLWLKFGHKVQEKRQPGENWHGERLIALSEHSTTVVIVRNQRYNSEEFLMHSLEVFLGASVVDR